VRAHPELAEEAVALRLELPSRSAAQIATIIFHRHGVAVSERTVRDQLRRRGVGCPAAAGKLRCPLRPESMTLSLDRPEILNPPEHPPRCCTQQSVTVPAEINAKAAQKHDYPGAAWRTSYARRSAAERTNATIKDPATNNIGRGGCRVTGLTAITLFLTCTLIVRNTRVIDAFETRQAEDQRRAAAGQPPRTRQRRRRGISELVDSA
jgi:hypothetical protein